MSHTPKIIPFYRKSNSPQPANYRDSASRLPPLHLESTLDTQFFKLKTERASRSNDPKKKPNKLRPIVLDPFRGKIDTFQERSSLKTVLRESKEGAQPSASTRNSKTERGTTENNQVQYDDGRNIQNSENRVVHFKIKKTSLSTPRNNSDEKTSPESLDTQSFRRMGIQNEDKNQEKDVAMVRLLRKYVDEKKGTVKPQQGESDQNKNTSSKQSMAKLQSQETKIAEKQKTNVAVLKRSSEHRTLTKKDLYDRATMKGKYKFRENNKVTLGSETPGKAGEEANDYLEFWGKVQESSILAKEQSRELNRQCESSCQLLQMF